MVVDSTLQTVLRALSSAPDQLGAGDDAPVMVVVLAREATPVRRHAGRPHGRGSDTTRSRTRRAVAFADLVLDGQTRRVRRGGRELDLTVTEFRLLEFLLRHPRQVLSRGTIFDRVWGFDLAATSNSLTVYIGYLRRKTEAGGEPRLIHTVRGVGYVLRD